MGNGAMKQRCYQRGYNSSHVLLCRCYGVFFPALSYGPLSQQGGTGQQGMLLTVLQSHVPHV